MILFVLGNMLKVEGILMIPSALVSIYYGEECAGAFVITICLLILIGIVATAYAPKNKVIYAREGFIIVALSWIGLSLFGALPFYISREIPAFIDCFFETVSGFTTTGASILTEIEHMPKGLLFWRSFTHWIGGMGVLVFMLAIIPLAGDRSMHLMRAEVPGPNVGKLTPKLKSTALILYSIYVSLTIIEIVLLLLGGMPLYDSLIHAFGTAGTGGFSSKNLSVAAYDSAYIDWVIAIFMLLFGVNFNVYYLLLIRNFSQALMSEELRVYLGIVITSMVVIAINIMHLFGSFWEAFRFSAFQVASIITTTGYATANFDLWPELSRCILVMLMVFGACAGSTGGGVKIARIVIMYKSAKREIAKMLHPRSVVAVKFEDKPLDAQTISGVHVFFSLYVSIVGASVLLVSLDNMDFQTTITAVFACINNIGPGLGMVGPIGNYFEFSILSKLVLSANMLLGRLEIFPILLLAIPAAWRKR